MPSVTNIIIGSVFGAIVLCFGSGFIMVCDWNMEPIRDFDAVDPTQQRSK